ncbi:ligand-dependent nuclear receptor-interacting factor 1 isoform X2 [Xiphias gladius]|nr:ligand-dependent nuclear receptor-interacting factor 1 isoform X2 [Xiphias gladius]
MPAVGADGKNIMKLIPVQMVNGKFVQNQISKPGMDSTPQKVVTINISSAPIQMVKKAALNPSATQQIVRKNVSFVNALPNQVELDLGNSLNKHSPQQQTVNLMAKVPPIATPATNCWKSVRLPCQLPVTVKSPALPGGQYLQIPPNAQVQTVPASELPPGIKRQIFTSSANSSPGSGLPNVVYVSPVTTVNQGVTPPCDSALHSVKLLSKTSNKTSSRPPAKGSKPLLKLIPKVSQRLNSPIKWVIEEEDSSMASTLNPPNSPFVTSEILRAVAERENTSKHCDVIKKKVSQLSESKSGQGLENALVMCNGKVFFVAEKCSLPFKMGKSNLLTAATQSYKFNKTIGLSTQQSLESVAAQTGQDLRIIIPDESDEVIDLCDDDAQDDSSQQAASVNMSAVSPHDDDNVIFVAYIPPKSEAGSPHDWILKTQMALEKETDQTGTRSSNSVTEEKSLEGRTGSDGRDKDSNLRGRRPGQSILVRTLKNVTDVCGSAVVNMHNNEGLNMKTQQSTSSQQVERMEMDVETESPAYPSTSDSSSGTYSQKQDTHRMETIPNPAPCWTSSLAPKPCQMADQLLRQVFGITADVKICLPRIDEASAGSVPCLDMNANTRRIGRTRKRTMCPCCIPVTLETAVKSSARLEEPENWAWLTEQMRKKGGRTRVPRKHGKTSGIS